MAGVMASSCCVCRCQLKEVVGKGRHKRLRSCSKEKSVWQRNANVLIQLNWHFMKTMLFSATVVLKQQRNGTNLYINGLSKGKRWLVYWAVVLMIQTVKWMILLPCHILLHNSHQHLKEQTEEQRGLEQQFNLQRNQEHL